MKRIRTNKTNKMKKTILTLMLAFVGTITIAQEMTIAHTGITTIPTSTDQSLTVSPGQDITFIYGGGQTHPMVESHPNTGAASTPTPFVTQTVSSSIPSVVFQISTIGTYVFHCQNNPGKDVNYGTIYVTEGGGSTAVQNVVNNPVSVYPNPVKNILTVKGLTESAAIYTLNGKKVMYVTNGTFNVSVLAKGTYIVKTSKYNTIFIKK